MNKSYRSLCVFTVSLNNYRVVEFLQGREETIQGVFVDDISELYVTERKNTLGSNGC